MKTEHVVLQTKTERDQLGNITSDFARVAVTGPDDGVDLAVEILMANSSVLDREAPGNLNHPL